MNTQVHDVKTEDIVEISSQKLKIKKKEKNQACTGSDRRNFALFCAGMDLSSYFGKLGSD